MFSGITNQFTSLVGAVKGGGPDEEAAAGQEAAPAEAPAPVEHDASAAAAAGDQAIEGEEGAKRTGSSLVDSLLTEATGWLGSAKGWLGSASASIPSMPAMPSMPSMPAMPAMPSIPSIPGLRKGGAGEGEEGGAVQAGDAMAAGGAATAGVDDDDKSRYISATEGADSHPASGGGTPTGDEGQIGQGKGDEVKITTKVTQQAKHFGSFLSSAINKAGAKIKETVKENPILESFNKEQEAFIKGQGGGADSGVAPWIGHANEAKIKEEILGLAQDRRNFVRAPPAGVDFDFNYETAYPTAIAIMAEDKALEQMRFELVPKIITEENFWRNYFYRVSLIIQAAELGTLGADGVGQASSGEDAAAKSALGASKGTRQPADNSVDTMHIVATVSNEKNNGNNTEPKKHGSKVSESDEFVSDAYQIASEMDLEEIKSGMRKLGIDSMTQQALSSNDEEQWEKDLEAELKDYEVVSDAVAASSSSSKRNSNNKRGGDSKRNSKKGGNKITTSATSKSKSISSSSSIGGGGGAAAATVAHKEHEDDDDGEIPTISNLRTRSTTNNDWEEEYADLIEDTDDLK